MLSLRIRDTLLSTIAVSLMLVGCNSQNKSEQNSEVVLEVSQSSALDKVTTEPVVNHRSGEAAYQQVCAVCHATGVNEAPKFGDAAAWAELIEEGYGILVYESIKGEGMMPPRGGDLTLSDMEMARAVAYMANAAGANFIEPTSDREVTALLEQAEKDIEAHEKQH
jgi:cytochrome c5